MTESKVQLNVEGTGPKVRTERVTTYSDDGLATPQTVEQQVVVLATRFGAFIESDQAWREEMLAETKRMTHFLEMLLETLT
jgi:hypothetical protein